VPALIRRIGFLWLTSVVVWLGCPPVPPYLDDDNAGDDDNADDDAGVQTPASLLIVYSGTEGDAGPGGAFSEASIIVTGMDGAGYRLPGDAPYSGPGANQHGSTDQFLAAVSFFAGKSRL